MRLISTPPLDDSAVISLRRENKKEKRRKNDKNIILTNYIYSAIEAMIGWWIQLNIQWFDTWEILNWDITSQPLISMQMNILTYITKYYELFSDNNVEIGIKFNLENTQWVCMTYMSNDILR